MTNFMQNVFNDGGNDISPDDDAEDLIAEDGLVVRRRSERKDYARYVDTWPGTMPLCSGSSVWLG